MAGSGNRSDAGRGGVCQVAGWTQCGVWGPSPCLSLPPCAQMQPSLLPRFPKKSPPPHRDTSRRTERARSRLPPSAREPDGVPSLWPIPGRSPVHQAEVHSSVSPSPPVRPPRWKAFPSTQNVPCSRPLPCPHPAPQVAAVPSSVTGARQALTTELHPSHFGFFF